MLRKVTETAEKFSDHVSRRSFLGSLGRSALTAAMTLAALLAVRAQAHAGRGKQCCDGRDIGYWICRRRKGQSCPPGFVPIPCALKPPFCDEHFDV